MNDTPPIGGVWNKLYIWNGSTDTSWYSENNNEFTINTPEQLAGLAFLVNIGKDNFEGKIIKLLEDIALNNTANWRDWGKRGKGKNAPANKWIPIGCYSCDDDEFYPFCGTFDGNGKVVSGIYINDKEEGNQGLFGCTESAEIKNLGLTDSYINGFGNIGGLAGNNFDSIINNCYSACTVKGIIAVGGLIGWNHGKMISDCYFTGKVIADIGGGGLVGRNYGQISNSYSSGTVKGTKAQGQSEIGELVGFDGFD